MEHSHLQYFSRRDGIKAYQLKTGGKTKKWKWTEKQRELIINPTGQETSKVVGKMERPKKVGQ